MKGLLTERLGETSGSEQSPPWPAVTEPALLWVQSGKSWGRWPELKSRPSERTVGPGSNVQSGHGVLAGEGARKRNVLILFSSCPSISCWHVSGSLNPTGPQRTREPVHTLFMVSFQATKQGGQEWQAFWKGEWVDPWAISLIVLLTEDSLVILT